MSTKFKELGLSSKIILNQLQSLGIDNPTEIQGQAIPLLMKNKNILGLSATGTGKTLAFVLPMLDKIMAGEQTDSIQALVISPTRELAKQIIDVARKVSSNHHKCKIARLIGGMPIYQQKKELKNAKIVIGTPGRIKMMLNEGYFSLKQIKTLVIDEMDLMLGRDFIKDIKEINKSAAKNKTVALMSATINHDTKKIAQELMPEYSRIEVTNKIKKKEVKSFICLTKSHHKVDLLQQLIESEKPDKAIIFVDKKRLTEKLSKSLLRFNIKSVTINSDHRQSLRMQNLQKFKDGKVNVIIGTDVISRGIDVPAVTHVFNYNLPQTVDDYIHRLGRTNRAEHIDGKAFTICDEQGTAKLQMLLQCSVNKAQIFEDHNFHEPAILKGKPKTDKNKRFKKNTKSSFKFKTSASKEVSKTIKSNQREYFKKKQEDQSFSTDKPEKRNNHKRKFKKKHQK